MNFYFTGFTLQLQDVFQYLLLVLLYELRYSISGIPIGVTSSAIGLKIWVITVAIKKYKSMINKKKSKYDKIVLLAKTKLNDKEKKS